jgi:hypothetical protein
MIPTRVMSTITCALFLFAALVPAAARAQAIAGSVKEPSGAPLPGVAVEISSPSLIEGERTARTDADGRYRVENLRPGTYVVRFALDGWSSTETSGIELTGASTLTVDATFVLSVSQSVSVTSAPTVVDIYSARHEITLRNELLRAIPTARSYNALLPLVAGVLTSSNDTVTGTATTSFPIYGGRASESRLLLDGLTVGSAPAGNSATSYVVDVGAAQEVTFTSGGASGEVETAGLVMNIVPKSGGNEMRGSLFASGTGSALQSSNLTQTLRDQGVGSATPLMKFYDVNGTFGGSLRRDRAWFFLNAHTGGYTRNSPTVFYNLNAGDPSAWLYRPDYTRPEYSDRTFENASGRITWQMTPRNKLGIFWDEQSLCSRCTGATPGGAEPTQVSPEAVGILGRPLRVAQVTWSSSMSNQLLLDVGFGGTFLGVGNFQRQPNPTIDLIRVAEQCANGCAANAGIPGLVYRSQDFSSAYTGSYLWRVSLLRTTGSRSWKIGYQHTLMTDDRVWFTNTQDLTYRVNNGSPNQLTESISPWVNDARIGWDAFFAQEQWTQGRITLQGAIRFDRATSWFPAQQEGPSRFLPDAIVVPETNGVDSYKDITPRFAATYDVFGSGKTALKFQLGKYVEGAGTIGNYANSNPTLRMPQTTSVMGTAGVTRTWIDANADYVPDCNLLSPDTQDLRASGGDFCGTVSDRKFGTNTLTNAFAPSILYGWGVRPSDWDLEFSIQQQVLSRASVEFSYVRRWFNGFFVVDNLALSPSDLTPYTITAPVDPRLLGGGGYTVSGLYDVVPDKVGQVSNFVTSASQFGKWSQRFDGVTVNVQVRAYRGLAIVAGASMGQTVADNCDVRAHLPELSTATTGTSVFGAGLLNSSVTPVSPYCHVASGFLPQFRGIVSYEVPRVGIQLASTFQTKPGPMLVATYAVRNSDVVPSLGRSLSGNVPNVTVNLIAPGALYGDRINQLDLRIGKSLKIRRTQTLVAIEAYNALNSSAVLTYNSAFAPGAVWPQPNSILTPRLVKLTAELTF